jgi:hypothetical protein
MCRAIPIAFILTATACSTDYGPPRKPAIDQCKDFVAQDCDRIVKCLVEKGFLAPANEMQNATDCVNQGMQGLDCTRVVGLEQQSRVDDCTADLGSIGCDQVVDATGKLLPIPATCRAIFLIR